MPSVDGRPASQLARDDSGGPEPLRQAGMAPDGLSSAEAEDRLRRFGPNRPAGVRRFQALRELLRYLANPLVLLLVAASGLSIALGQVASAVVVTAMVALSVALNFAHSYRSQRAAARLRERVAHTAIVRRDGTTREIPADQIVPGDVVVLAAGAMVPADGRLLQAKDLFLNEGALTGESLPQEKHPTADAAAPLGAVFAGTSVISGTGVAAITLTGAATRFGAIAERLRARPPETEFERGTRRFGLLILQVAMFLVLFVFLVNARSHHDPLQAFLFAVALAVGITPELLPMIVSVTLSAGAVRMADKKVVVKRLAAIEDLGSMDLLCSDKTGTLTQGELELDRAVDVAGAADERTLCCAALNAAYKTGIRTPMDDAILRAPHPDVALWHAVDEIPFDFERRRVSVVVERDGRRELIAKGAPEQVLPVCAHVAIGDRTTPMTDPERARATAAYTALSADGLRVLAVARAAVETRPAYSVADERELVLVGFVAFVDPPLEGVAATIRALADDGVTVKILTGDNDLVACHVCAAVGLPHETLVTGDALDAMSDQALGAVAERTAVFARVSPVQKHRIVQALRARGHVVGFMGDGINDAPSLRSADVGISVQNAVDVARDAADVILLEKRLSVLHDGVLEGRRSFGNIMKYVLMGTSSNFGNMLSMAAASLVLPFLPMLPMQVLLNNFLYDLAQVAIPSDAVDETYLVKPKHWNVAAIRTYMLAIGPISSIYDFATFFVLLSLFRADQALFHTGWFVESLATQTLVIFVIRTAARPWASRPSRALTLGVLGAVATAIALPYSPLAPWLGFAPLPATFFGALVVLVTTYLALVEAVKRWFYRRYLV